MLSMIVLIAIEYFVLLLSFMFSLDCLPGRHCRFGTCNERTHTCKCRVGYGGKFCSIPLGGYSLFVYSISAFGVEQIQVCIKT